MLLTDGTDEQEALPAPLIEELRHRVRDLEAASDIWRNQHREPLPEVEMEAVEVETVDRIWKQFFVLGKNPFVLAAHLGNKKKRKIKREKDEPSERATERWVDVGSRWWPWVGAIQ